MEISEEFQLTMLKRAMRMLDSIGAEYKIVYDNNQFGQLKVVPVPKEKKFAHGERRRYYSKYLTQLSESNRYVQIPSGGYPLLDIQSGASSVLSTTYGAGNYTTSINRELDVVEVILL